MNPRMSMKSWASLDRWAASRPCPRTALHEESIMGDQQARAMGGSCLGGLLGLFLGGVAGGLWGWLYVGGATANDPRGVAILDIVNAVLFWIVAPFGTIVGGLVGGIVGAVCGAGIA